MKSKSKLVQVLTKGAFLGFSKRPKLIDIEESLSVWKKLRSYEKWTVAAVILIPLFVLAAYFLYALQTDLRGWMGIAFNGIRIIALGLLGTGSLCCAWIWHKNTAKKPGLHPVSAWKSIMSVLGIDAQVEYCKARHKRKKAAKLLVSTLWHNRDSDDMFDAALSEPRHFDCLAGLKPFVHKMLVDLAGTIAAKQGSYADVSQHLVVYGALDLKAELKELLHASFLCSIVRDEYPGPYYAEAKNRVLPPLLCALRQCVTSSSSGKLMHLGVLPG